LLANPSRINTSQSIIVRVFSVSNPTQPDPSLNAIDLPPVTASNLEGYLISRGQTLVYRTALLDTSAAFRFQVHSSYGQQALMVVHANGQYNISRMTQSQVDSYQYISSLPDSDVETVSVSQADRENGNAECRNGSFAARGGNDNCTIYQAI
jgi:hypothetical protein